MLLQNYFFPYNNYVNFLNIFPQMYHDKFNTVKQGLRKNNIKCLRCTEVSGQANVIVVNIQLLLSFSSAHDQSELDNLTIVLMAV